MNDSLGFISNNLPPINRDLNTSPSNRAGQSGGSGKLDFRRMLEKEIAQVNEMQQDASNAVEDLAAGRRDDLEGVIIATQKADTAFKMLLQVRNKVMDALDEIKQVRI